MFTMFATTSSFNLVISVLFLLNTIVDQLDCSICQVDQLDSCYPDYDCRLNKYNLFTLQWKPQMCFKSNHSNCFKEGVPNITIHGIWQNYYTEKYPTVPEYCVDSELFDEHVDDITEQLNVMWPSYRKDNNFEFWEHEWDKHGTCWNIVNQSEYFQTALDWVTQYDIEKAFADSNIYPSNCYDDESINCKKYPLKDVNGALDKVLHLKTTVSCHQKNSPFIQEFVMCRDWYGNPINCPYNLDPINQCDDMVVLSEQIYPTYSEESNICHT